MLFNAVKISTILIGRFLCPVVTTLFTYLHLIINALNTLFAARRFRCFSIFPSKNLFPGKERPMMLGYLKIFVKFVTEDDSIIYV